MVQVITNRYADSNSGSQFVNNKYKKIYYTYILPLYELSNFDKTPY